MRLAWLGVLVLLGCGGAAATTAPARSPVAEAAVDGDVHLGCTVITPAMIDARLAVFRDEAQTPTRAEIRDRLVRRAVAHRLGDQLHISVSDDEVDDAIANLALQNNVSVDDIYAAARGYGIDRDAYRSDVADQILVVRVGVTIAPGSAGSTQGEAAWNAALDRAAREWMAVPVRWNNAECVEGAAP